MQNSKSEIRSTKQNQISKIKMRKQMAKGKRRREMWVVRTANGEWRSVFKT